MPKIIGNTTATPNPRPDWNQTDATKADYIKNKPELGNMATKDEVAKSDLSADVQASLGKADTAIQSVAGLATEKFVTDAIEKIPTPDVSGQINTHNTSSNAHSDIRQSIANIKAVSYESQSLTEAQKAQARANIGAGASGFSGNYEDLENKPDIPAALADLTSDATHRTVTDTEKSNWNAAKTHASSTHAPADAEKNVQSDWFVTNTSSDAYIKNKPTLAIVATSGDYNDLINKPDIPVVNNATLTIQKNGANVATFTANSASNATANITVPTKVSELTNDSGFKTVDTNTTYDLAAPASKTNGNVTIDLTAGGSGSGTDSVKIKGSGATTVTTDVNGVITISSTDTNTQDGNDNQKIKGNGTSFGINDEINIVGSGATTVTADTTNKKIIVSSPEALKNPKALSIGGKSYDGSSDISVTASDLGIANAIHFIGETTTALTDGTTTAAVTINGSSKTPVSGDVVLCGSKEFIWNGSAWKELGDGSSHALKTNTITAGSGLTGGGQIGSSPTLNVGAGNGITVTTDAVAAKAGNGITVDSNGINHADTSSQASVTANGRKYITGVTLDTYGHVTGLTTGTETVTDTHNSHAVISGKKADGSTDIKGTASSGDITLGDSGVTAGEYGPTSNQTPAYGATFNVPDIKVNAKGIVTSVTNRTVKIPASDNTNQTVKTGSVTFGASDAVEFKAGTNVSVSGDATDKTIIISATDTTYSEATTSAAGLMSATDKSKLDGIATGANKTTVDSALSTTSTNPVQNKVVNDALESKLPKSGGSITGNLSVDGTINGMTVTYDSNAKKFTFS